MYLKLIMAFALSLASVLVFMPMYINYLKKIEYNQIVCDYSLDEFKEKAKTPTMGGVLFVLVPIIITILVNIFELSTFFSDLDIIIVMLAYFGYAMIGFIDDYIIVIKKDNEGLSPKAKLIAQVVLAIIFYLIYMNNASTELYIPIIKVTIPLGIFYAFFVFFMFTAESNAVNFTDGMDGLAAGCSFIALIPFLIFSFMNEKVNLAIFIVSVLGALLGYLKYNIKPAKIFMGDTGSLALGALLASVAMVLKKEVALIFIGGVFVWEMACVCIQLTSVKLRHKRVFKYTPIHYSFVISGVKEERVVRSIWLLGLVCAIIGFFIGIL